MRKVLSLSAVGCVFLTLAGRAAAQDENRAVIKKAIKATGGEEKLAKLNTAKAKFKSTGEFAGITTKLAGEITTQMPRQMKLDIQVEAQGQNLTLLIVLNGDKAWLQVAGETTAIKGKELGDLKEELHAQQVETLVPLLKDKAYKLHALGEAKVGGLPAVGVRVESRGHKDVNLYFDKKTGLLVKAERRALDDAEKEVTEETFYRDYKDVGGVKVPMKVVVHHDGKKYLEMEITEYRFPDKLDDSEFARPGGKE
jgi:outer membrane lipoprotein-sorting protein